VALGGIDRDAVEQGHGERVGPKAALVKAQP
jgi:hypothetical protein